MKRSPHGPDRKAAEELTGAMRRIREAATHDPKQWAVTRVDSTMLDLAWWIRTPDAHELIMARRPISGPIGFP